MARAAKVENYCFQHCSGAKQIVIEGSERACINCIWYDPYFHENRGNIAGRIRTSLGWCIKQKKRRGALQKPCKGFETENPQQA